MKSYGIIIAVMVLLGGCAPKMGKDIIIEPSGHLRWENTKSEVMLGLLSLLGGPADKEMIRIGTDVTIINRWHSAMKLKSFTYTLADEQKTLASGSACVNEKGFVVEANTKRSLALVLEIDLHNITMNRLIAIVQEKSKMSLRGEAVVEVWGLEYRYAFTKDATLLITKALNARK
jgi:LEA14-like dessication related protein